MLHAGRFVESVEGRISFPTIRKPILQEVVAFLTSQSSSQQFRPFGGDANPAVPVAALVELLMAAHFLDLPALMDACARSLSPRFLELPSLRHFPDEVLLLLLRHLPTQLLYVAERKLWKQHRQSVRGGRPPLQTAPQRRNARPHERMHPRSLSRSLSRSVPLALPLVSLPTRQLWHALFERKFRTVAPSTKVARSDPAPKTRRNAAQHSAKWERVRTRDSLSFGVLRFYFYLFILQFDVHPTVHRESARSIHSTRKQR